MFLRQVASHNHYQTLGVQLGASTTQVKAAFRDLAKKWHPDQNGNDAKAELKFRQIREAYECLSDRAKRNEYDKICNRQGFFRPLQNPESVKEFSGVPDDGSLTRKQLVFLYSVALVLPAFVSIIRSADNSLPPVNRETENLVFHASPPVPEASMRDRLVRAFYNPVSKSWERLGDEQEPPRPLDLFKSTVRENRGAYSATFQTVRFIFTHGLST